jgi:hypothetical protein
MYRINLYRSSHLANIEQLSAKRDWMDNTVDSHAYKCFPVSLTNQLGWGISFPEDITFIWDGISDTSDSHVKILEGEKYCYTGRANATLSFHTGLMFETEENVSLLQMPVANLFPEGYEPFTTIISTSFFKGDLPCAIRINKANVPITIKANTPIVCIIPISLTELQNSEIIFKDIKTIKNTFYTNSQEYSNAIYSLNVQGKWSNFYRNAVDHLGNILGKHEVKSIKLKTIKGNNE